MTTNRAGKSDQRARKSVKKVKGLRAKSLSSKQAKNVKGGYEGSTVATYNFTSAWPKK
jgi:hypothetical protein